ncbi:MAG: hypothetical protein Q8K68_14005 [Nitrospirota bacterium]|nr:hypothetical protein [Nitrospirota bacterium]
MRRSVIYLAVVVVQAAIAVALAVHAATEIKAAGPRLERENRIVSALKLTDLCLFTEARYTRHPSMADRNTAFQDYPFSFEHFPSGSLLPVPEIVRKR